MNFLARTRGGTATLLAFGAMLGGANLAHAQSPALDTIFSQVTPSMRDRLFMRLNYIHATVKTSSGEAYDVTGPVVGKNDIRDFIGTGSGYTSIYNSNVNFTRKYYGSAASAGLALEQALERDAPTCARYAEGLGTPCDFRARGQTTVGTLALSAGYFLDDARNWVIEAFLLAAPLSVDVKGDGPNSLAGETIIKTKLLPPTVILSRYFGAKDDRLRPFFGMGGSYAIFFDTRATGTLNNYVGGVSGNDTTVSIKNALGFGPFAGFKFQIDEDWHVNLNVGKLRYKTDATLVTRNTVITKDSAVLRDYGPNIVDAIQTGDAAILVGSNGGPPRAPANDPAGFAEGSIVPGVTALMCDLATAKNNNVPTCNHGSFTRKQKTRLDNTLFMLSVGRSF